MNAAAARVLAIICAKYRPEPGMTPMEAIIGRRMPPAERTLADRCLEIKLQPYLDAPITPESEAAVARTILQFAESWRDR